MKCLGKAGLALLALAAAWFAPPASAQTIPASIGFLISPLACGDPECLIRYPNPYTPGMMNSVLDHSMVEDPDGFWSYGTVSVGGADGVVLAFNGEVVQGRPKIAAETCIGGTIRLRPDHDDRPMTNTESCGPGYASYDEHPGYDYRAAPGTRVRAAGPGRVLNLAGQPCYRGNLAGDCAAWGYVGINHGNGYVTQYGHLSRIDVRPGERVARGQTIGLSGHTAPMPVPDQLHFEVLRIIDGDFLVVDPYGWVGGGKDPLYSARLVQSANLWLQDDGPEDVPAFDLARTQQPAADRPARAVLDSTGPRIALVIGVGDYGGRWDDLPFSKNDARGMGKILARLGFDVDLQIDPDQRAMKEAIAGLRKRLDEAGPSASALFFFAGHGMQSGSVNYLLPAGAALDDVGDVALQAVSAATILNEMREAGVATSILILDACRDVASIPGLRGAAQGLAEMSAKEVYGTLIAYSTAPGSVASDGSGPHSPYTGALLKEIDRPGQDISTLFERVRLSVLAQTRGQQLPWESTSLIGPFYFAPKSSASR
jgi:murein DD-endopeptidase MepM/ murein hydrolase activator NlpD